MKKNQIEVEYDYIYFSLQQYDQMLYSSKDSWGTDNKVQTLVCITLAIDYSI